MGASNIGAGCAAVGDDFMKASDVDDSRTANKDYFIITGDMNRVCVNLGDRIMEKSNIDTGCAAARDHFLQQMTWLPAAVLLWIVH